MATLTAFNRWLDGDWGFAYKDRIMAVPLLSLTDPEDALVEVERVLEAGARAVHLRPAPGALADLIGVERFLIGSDWPHGEGLAQPTNFEKELTGFGDQAKRQIMRDNCSELLGMAA